MNAEFLVAVHALAFLNHKQSCVSSEELAKNICTNPARVRKVMLKLKNAGLVETVSGSLGGYSFTKKAERVSLKDILRATGGTVSDIEWKSGNEDADCLISSGMGKVMDDVIENINLGAEKYLAGITILDVDKKLKYLKKNKS
ncbi:MAG: Rrf2 family transcriptional regulator [Treponema sp.]